MNIVHNFTFVQHLPFAMHNNLKLAERDQFAMLSLITAGHLSYLRCLFRIDCLHAAGTIGELTIGQRLQHLKRFIQFYYFTQNTKSGRDKLLLV